MKTVGKCNTSSIVAGGTELENNEDAPVFGEIFRGDADEKKPLIVDGIKFRATTLELYPNPAVSRSSITVEYLAVDEKAQLRIVDMTGKVVRTVDSDLIAAGWNKLIIPLESLPAGTYIMTDTHGNHQRFMW